MSSLAVAQLTIYATLSLPIAYILIRHGKSGILGWGYLLAFCSLRIIGDALQISAEENHSSSTTPALISNIGLSPLLLATEGIIHEARLYRHPSLDKKLETIIILFIHILIGGGIGLAASGGSALSPTGSSSSSNLTILRIGICTLAIAWGVLVLWAFFSLSLRQTERGQIREDGSLLLYATLFSLPFTGIRVFSSLASVFKRSSSLNPVTGSLAVRVCLYFLPELISILGYIFAGLKTASIRKGRNLDEEEEGVRMVRSTGEIRC